jgi:hypothetical protein
MKCRKRITANNIESNLANTERATNTADSKYLCFVYNNTDKVIIAMFKCVSIPKPNFNKGIAKNTDANQ